MPPRIRSFFPEGQGFAEICVDVGEIDLELDLSAKDIIPPQYIDLRLGPGEQDVHARRFQLDSGALFRGKRALAKVDENPHLL